VGPGSAPSAWITLARSGVAEDPAVTELLESGPAVQTYSALASVLAGFAFTALVLYLGRQDHRDERDVERVDPVQIVKTLFYAMCALMICAFLYARLSGETQALDRVLLGLSFYGLILGAAVLSLFYALNLVMLNHEGTREAAQYTRWVVAAAGPAVVLCLLADVLDSAWVYGCGGGCSAWLSPRWWGFALAAVFMALGLVMTRPGRSHGLLGRLFALRPAAALIRRLRRKPHFPSWMTLMIATAVGMGSLWIRGMSAVLDPRLWAHAVLLLATVNLAVFAIATGSVLAASREGAGSRR
jgi:hypothetical protein